MALLKTVVSLINCMLTGNGTIQIKSDWQTSQYAGFSGLAGAQIFANAFDGVQLNLFGLKRNVHIRNNKFHNMANITGALNRCDAVDGGYSSGCDMRAACTDDVNGGVQCNCTNSGLIPATDAGDVVRRDGSKCSQLQVFDVHAELRHVQLEVKKPHDSELVKFEVTGKGDKSFGVHVHVQYLATSSSNDLPVDKQYLIVTGDQLQPLGNVPMALSSARPEVSQTLTLRANGSRTKWSDALSRQAFVRVSYGGKTKSLQVTVILQPYGSCQNTMVWIDGINQAADHLSANIRVHLVAKDTDNYLITTTPFNTANNTYFKVLLGYPGSSTRVLDIVRDSTNGSLYSAAVPRAAIEREGAYELSVRMDRAWAGDESKGWVTTCVPDAWQNLPPTLTTFRVVCAAGFASSEVNGKRCTPQSDDFGQVCKQARVALSGNGYLSGRPPSAGPSSTLVGLIGPDGDLHVAVDQQSGIDTVDLVPIAGRIRVPFSTGGTFKTRLTKTGDFTVLISNNKSAGCSLPSTLSIKCKQAMIQKGTRCHAKPDETNLNVILGVCMGVVLAGCTVLLLYFIQRNPAKAKKYAEHKCFLAASLAMHFCSPPRCSAPRCLSYHTTVDTAVSLGICVGRAFPP